MKKIFVTISLLFFLFARGHAGVAGERAVLYTIHGASYQKLDNAIENTKELKTLGYDSYYRKVTIPGKGVWYRVYIGRYTDRDHALGAAKKLVATHAIDTFILRNYEGPASGGASPTRGGKNTAADASAPTGKRAGKRAGEASPPAGKAAAPEGPQVKGRAAVPQPGDVAAKTAGNMTTAGKAAPTAQAPEEGDYERALGHFDAGEYEQALDLLNGLSRQKLDPARQEQVLTRLADCHYFLAQKGDSRHYLAAVDSYKGLLKRYTDPRKGNAATYYRLARSYENLKFYYESLGAFEKLVLQYPDSPYHQEATFKIGMMLRQTRKFMRAVEKLSAYVRENPDGPFARIASYSIGDCYDQLGQRDNAENWYVYAQKRWHDIGGLPKGVLRNFGIHDFQRHKFAEAVDIFSLYLSLYPDDRHNKTVLAFLASAYREMKQPNLAVKILSLLMEKYPGTKEAQEGAMIMANMGIASPGMKFPAYQAGIDNYYDPVKTYDALLQKFPTGTMAEKLLYQKGLALEAFGRNKEALDTYAVLLKRFPRSMYREEGERSLTRNLSLLVNKDYKAGDHIAVADLYFRIVAAGMVKGVDRDILWKSATSLKKIGLYKEAALVFSTMAKSPRDAAEENRLLLVLADVSRLQGKDDEAEKTLLVLLKRHAADREEFANAKIMLAEIYSRKRLYEKAIPLYAEAFGEREGMVAGAARAYLKYANALREQKMFPLAVKNYQLALQDFNRNRQGYSPDVAADAYLGSGDALYRERKYREGLAMYEQSLAVAPAKHYKSWALYHAGQGYTQLKDTAMADKTFNQLKESGTGEFWEKVPEYWRADHAWFEKNIGYLK